MWALAVTGIQDTLIDCKTENDETVCTDPNYGIWFVLFVSFFFTHQVLQNCVHCAVAGVVGSWWFTPNSNGCCSSAVLGSFVRTMTTSFGSICFGSLLVAIIQAIRQLAEQARQNDEVGQALACCIDCILGCLQSLLEYFNKWVSLLLVLYKTAKCFSTEISCQSIHSFGSHQFKLLSSSKGLCIRRRLRFWILWGRKECYAIVQG